MAEQPGITVQVIGLGVGLHPGLGKQFILLDMGGRVPDVAYEEGVAGPALVEQEDTVQPYRRLWDELRAVALDPAASRDLIARYLPGAP